MRFNNYDIEAIAIASRYALRLRAVTHEQCDCTNSLFSPFVNFYWVYGQVRSLRRYDGIGRPGKTLL